MKSKTFIQLFFLLFVINGLCSKPAFSDEGLRDKKEKSRQNQSQTFDPSVYAILNINNLTTWQRKDGYSNHSPNKNDGVFFPRNTAHVIYQDGILWGAKAFIDADLTIPAPYDQPIRVGGATYGTGSVEGWVEGFGADAVPVNKDDPRARVYRIRRDWLEMSAEEIKQDAADCFEVPVSEVSQDQIKVIMDDYLWCWENWPTDLGAPFIDRNNNGIYDPPPSFKTDVPKSDPGYFGSDNLISGNFDEPGLAGANPNVPADQVIWAVWNDLDREVSVGRFGSEPTGLELQSTLWGYNRSDALGDIIFRKIKFINKGGVEIDEQNKKGIFYLDSMYVGQWSDPDVGNAGDDLVGCDTVLNIGFVYNGNEVDGQYQDFALPPPSCGYDILQGPIIPSDNGIAIADFKYRPNYINLKMNGFTYFTAGSSFIGASPSVYQVDTIRMYKRLRGFAPLDGPDEYYRHPPGVTPGPFPLSGDPVAGTGHIDGLGEDYSFVPGDRRLMCSSGPWQMAPGDTQEVVFGIVCGLGADRLSGISVMKYNSRFAQKFYDSLLSQENPKVKLLTKYPDSSTTEIQTQVNLNQFENVTGCEIHFTPLVGSEPDFKVSLFDDGTHNDNLAGDFIWGNSITQTNRKYPFEAKLIVHTISKQDTFPVLTNVKLRPSPRLINWRVVWENGQQDSHINHNETVHLRFDILNSDSLNDLSGIDILNLNPASDFQRIHYEPSISAGSTADHKSLYLEIYGPDQDDSLMFHYKIIYDHFDEIFSFTIPVLPWEAGPVWGDTLAVVSEKGVTYNVFPIIADPVQLTGHTYQLSFFSDEDSNQVQWWLIDKTTNVMKYQNGQISSAPYFSHPVIDGIEYIVKPGEIGFQSFECVANGAGPLNPPESAAAPWQGFPVPRLRNPDGNPTENQQVGAGKWLISTGDHKNDTFDRGPYSVFIERSCRHNVLALFLVPFDWEMRFTAHGSYSWKRYDNEEVVHVPFELWCIGKNTPDDPSDDYKLIPNLLEGLGYGEIVNNKYDLAFWGVNDHVISDDDDDPFTDWLYWHNPADKSPGTIGYDAWEASLDLNAMTITADSDRLVGNQVLSRIVLVNWDGGSAPPFNQDLPEEGTVFRLVTLKPNFPGDVLYIESPVSVLAKNEIPVKFSLAQNYPNPFNPITNISFSLAKDCHVKLEIFNIMGQKVKTIINKPMSSGKHSIIWDGRDDAGIKLSSGLYFYRIKTNNFLRIKKMTLLK